MENIITRINLKKRDLVRGEKNKVQIERCVTDIIKENQFTVIDFTGPYIVNLSIEHNKLVLIITNLEYDDREFRISLSDIRKIIKDYTIICDSYISAVQSSDPRKIEAIDMGRRGVHNEGAQILQDMLEYENIQTDFQTARHFFTLLSSILSA